MDNATHAFAGMLLADATLSVIEQRSGVPASKGLRRSAVTLGIVAAELPDADLLYSGPVVGMGKLGYLLHHRGHTHTVVFALLAALLMWWVVMRIRQRSADEGSRASERWPLLALAVVGTMSHLLLDFTNSYGVHPLWPLQNSWYYGDAVFIVEPLIWAIAIPALLFGPRRTWGRVILALLLVAILAAAWTLGQTTTAIAAFITVVAVLCLAVQKLLTPRIRVASAIGVWCALEVMFAVSSSRANTLIRDALRQDAPTERFVDAALSPGPANPLCFDALIVSIADGDYRVRAAQVAAWSSKTADNAPSTICASRVRGSRFGLIGGATAMSPTGAPGVTWTERWSAPLEELRTLVATRCEVAAALRFMRVPVWHFDGDTVSLSDVRFGGGGGGFSDLRISAGTCPLSPDAWIPPWTTPLETFLSANYASKTVSRHTTSSVRDRGL